MTTKEISTLVQKNFKGDTYIVIIASEGDGEVTALGSKEDFTFLFRGLFNNSPVMMEAALDALTAEIEKQEPLWN